MSQILANTVTGDFLEVKKAQRTVDLIHQSYIVTLESGMDGWIIAKCPALNVVTQGKTIKEAKKNAREAMDLMVEEFGKDKEFSIIVKRTKSA